MSYYIWTSEGWLSKYVVIGDRYGAETTINFQKAATFSDKDKALAVAKTIDAACDSYVFELVQK